MSESQLADDFVPVFGSYRIDGLPAFETRIDATSGKDNTAVTVVQWLRFGGPSTLRIIGSAPRPKWPDAFPRFRAVRDGIQPRS